MTRFSRQSLLLALAVGIAALYLYYFTDWINPPRIQIIAQARPPLPGSPDVPPILFALDRPLAVTAVRLIPTSPGAGSAATLWHLVATTNSTPAVDGFAYGANLRGLRPADPKNPRPAPLEPGATYRLLVEAGRARGQVEFRTPAAAPAN